MIAQSTRSRATSTALLKNKLVFEICRVAIWASVHTFLKSYALIHAARSDAALSTAVLSLVLDSIPNIPPPSVETAWKVTSTGTPIRTLPEEEVIHHMQ